MSDKTTELFDESGALDPARLTEDALDVLEGCVVWLTDIGRSVFLPIDLLAVLLERGHGDLERMVRGSARSDDDGGSVDQLRSLARRVERDIGAPPRLHTENFSLGFTGILSDALAWAAESGRDRIDEPDLARVMRWRAELQESASIRWALRQLAQPGGEAIFEFGGELRRSAFAPRTWSALQDGMRLSARSGLGFLGTPHSMAALAMSGGLLARACERASLRPKRLRDELLAIVGDRSPTQREFGLSRQTITPRLVRLLIAASKSAEARSAVIGERDLLRAFLGDGGSSLDLIGMLGLTPHVRALLDSGDGPERVSVVHAAKDASGDTPTLDQLGRDLTADARAGRLPTVLGRDEELQRVINVLMRTEQRNPLLTGHAGVGKTALANALAQRIAEGTVPSRLANMRVVEINGASLVGGTSYRGELEARIRALLEECEDDVILFIDEAHAVFAPRSSSGQPAEIPNHFKAALASGKIAVVAATTEAEYRRWIEDDPALRRRFERIRLAELSPEVTREILGQLAPSFEQDYEVPVTPDAVDAAIELSVRFVPEQSLPDKAKKILMDATIAVSSELAAGSKGAAVDTQSRRVVTRMDVARQVARKTGAPLDRVARGSISWWVGLEERLAARVVGQDRASAEVARSLIASRLKTAGRRVPQGILVLIGPPGVGKVDLTRGLAEEVYGSRDALISLEMSEFSDAHSMSRLIGSPPGYVGYSDEDALVTPLRSRPSSVVLLRSFSRAHPRVQERFLRLFSEGEIQDTRGMVADASHAIFVLTVETDPQPSGGIGFASASAREGTDALRDVDRLLADRLRGLDVSVVLFDGVQDGGGALAQALLERRMAQFAASLADEYEIRLEVSDEVRDQLAASARGVTDARMIERLFRERVIEPVTQLLLAGAVGPTLVLGEAAMGFDDVTGPTTEAGARTPTPERAS